MCTKSCLGSVPFGGYSIIQVRLFPMKTSCELGFLMMQNSSIQIQIQFQRLETFSLVTRSTYRFPQAIEPGSFLDFVVAYSTVYLRRTVSTAHSLFASVANISRV